MITLFDEEIAFSDYVQFLKNKDNTIIINGSTGLWGMIDSCILDKINYCINNKISPATYIRKLESNEDKQQLTEIFQVLLDEGMLKRAKDEEIKTSLKELEFKLTNKCNLKCLHCAASSDISKLDLLSTEDMKKIIDKLTKVDSDSLILTGGEPLIRKDIKVLLTYIRENYKGTINMITNGTMIDKEMALLLKECVNGVSISIDGYDEASTEFIRGKGVFDKVIKAVSYLKEVGYSKENIILTMTGTEQNYNHREDFENLCESLNVTGGVRQFSALGRGLDNFNNIGVKDYLSSSSNLDIESIRESLECRIFCKAGIKKIMINELGEVYPCLLLSADKYKLGSILEQDIDDIFNSEIYNEFIKNHLRKSIVDNISKCKDCNVRYFCMDKCLGVSNSYYDNEEICSDRCKQIKPFLTRVLWDE